MLLSHQEALETACTSIHTTVTCMWYLFSACNVCTDKHVCRAECLDTSAHLDVLHIGQNFPSDQMLGAWARGLKQHWSNSHELVQFVSLVLPPAVQQLCPLLQSPFELRLTFLFTLCKIGAPPGAEACCSHQCLQTVRVKGKALLSLCARCHFSQVMVPAKSAPKHFSKQCLTAYLLRSKPHLAAFNTFPSLFLCIKINFMKFPR